MMNLQHDSITIATEQESPFKLVSAFKWISDASKYNGNNLKWILKMDDDVLLGIQELEKFIKNIPQEDLNAIFCKIKPHDPTIRGKFKG